jgi:hypothetical protein
MELTERERRILAELEHQLSTGTPRAEGRRREGAPIRRGLRPRWTVVPAAVLGSLLLVAGIGLRITGSLLLATFLVAWWSSPLLWRLLRRAGRAFSELFKDAPPRAAA